MRPAAVGRLTHDRLRDGISSSDWNFRGMHNSSSITALRQYTHSIACSLLWFAIKVEILKYASYVQQRGTNIYRMIVSHVIRIFSNFSFFILLNINFNIPELYKKQYKKLLFSVLMTFKTTFIFLVLKRKCLNFLYLYIFNKIFYTLFKKLKSLSIRTKVVY